MDLEYLQLPVHLSDPYQQHLRVPWLLYSMQILQDPVVQLQQDLLDPFDLLHPCWRQYLQYPAGQLDPEYLEHQYQ
jgi:hypothetical protein